MSDIQIVAEIGCNHNGSVELAKKMMKKAKEAGADAVKFQSFVPENLVSRYAPKAEYQKKNDGNGSQLDMLKKLALTETEYLELVQYASTLDIQIFSTPFDFESFSFLQKIGQNIWKVRFSNLVLILEAYSWQANSYLPALLDIVYYNVIP